MGLLRRGLKRIDKKKIRDLVAMTGPFILFI